MAFAILQDGVMIACYIIGEPGVGKTTLMNGLLTQYERGQAGRLTLLLWGEPLKVGDRQVGWHLGKPRELFGGTDALSMSVHPEAVEWARTQADGIVYGEGQRLATAGFLTALAERGPLLVLHLHGPDFAEEHRQVRGTGQNDKWVRGARTRVENLVNRLQGAGVEVRTVQAGSGALDEALDAWSSFS